MRISIAFAMLGASVALAVPNTLVRRQADSTDVADTEPTEQSAEDDSMANSEEPSGTPENVAQVEGNADDTGDNTGDDTGENSGDKSAPDMEYGNENDMENADYSTADYSTADYSSADYSSADYYDSPTPAQDDYAPKSTETAGYKYTPNPLHPSYVHNYNVWSGALTYNPTYGRIRKTGYSPDITHIATFWFPWYLKGRHCRINFYLDQYSINTGSKKFDIFTTLQRPPQHSTTSWPPGNQRDQHWGRRRAHRPGFATVVPGYPNKAYNFPCPYGKYKSYEFVGVNDKVHIRWNKNTAGPTVRWW